MDSDQNNKMVRISLHLIAKRNLPVDSHSWPQDKIVEELNKISHLRLDRENISCIDSLELLGKCLTNVYLQHNKIEKLENLECLSNLQFLTVSHNEIKHVSGLSSLESLRFLDLSHNHIREFDTGQFPCNLLILDMRENPCSESENYRSRIVQNFPSIRQLDGREVTREEQRSVGLQVSSSESSDDEEEEEEEDEDNTTEVSMGRLTTRMMLCSLSRTEEELEGHRGRLLQLDTITHDLNLPSARSARSQHTS